MQLILHRGTREQRSASDHLVEDAAHPPGTAGQPVSLVSLKWSYRHLLLLLLPHVDGCGVLSGAEQHVRRSVPQRHHFIGVGLGWYRLGSSQTWTRGKPASDHVIHCHEGAVWIILPLDALRNLCDYTKVSQFELSFLVDEQVLRLEVSVKNLPPVAVRQTSQKLEQEDLTAQRRQAVRVQGSVRQTVRIDIINMKSKPAKQQVALLCVVWMLMTEQHHPHQQRFSHCVGG